jgi:2',3'-cyclic-nucleotide 2'-phosphodiesterase (5'-nucleotidase family)
VTRSATIAGVLVALLATACGRGEQSSAPAAGPSATISIVGTNDLHGGILPRDGRGGLALLAGYVNNLRAARARDGGAVLLVDAGDMFQGTLESNVGEGASVIAAYNALAYTAATIGNHEFDFGPVGPAATPRAATDDPRGAIKARTAEARFPILAANLLDESTGQPVAWPNVRPSVVVDAAGFKVGLIGVITKVALSTTIAANVHGLAVAPLAAAIQAQASQLRAQGAAAVIVSAHAGARCTDVDQPLDLSSCEPASQEIIDVARALPPGLVDHIVAGHVHAAMAYEVNGIAITEAYSGGRAFGRVDLTMDRASGRVTKKQIFTPRDLCAREDPATHTCGAGVAESALVPVVYEGAPVTPDPKIDAILAPAIERVRELKARPIGIVLDGPVRRGGDVESPLGNLVTDALLASVPGADVAINNTNGGLRADLPPGPMTYGNLFEVVPFDNLLVSIRLSGADLRKVLSASLQRTRPVPGISGIRVRAACASGALAVTMLRPSGAPIRDDERLLVSTMDFLATGGDGILSPVMPPGGFAVATDGTLARDDIADWLRRRSGHLREEDLINPANPRWQYSETPPIDCRGR